MRTYTTKRITVDSLTPSVLDFFHEVGHAMTEHFSADFEWKKFKLRMYLENANIIVCRRGLDHVGLIMFRMYNSVFDSKTKIVYQDLLYGKYPRVTRILLNEMIDFGKGHADHIITMTTPLSNIKGESLEKLGFEKLETLYRMKVDNG